MRSLFFACLLVGVPLVGRTSDFATRTLEATYKLFNRDSTATGFFVTGPAVEGETSKDILLVTAGHVFKKMTGEKGIVVLRDLKEDGSYQRHDWRIPIREGGKDLWFNHPSEDVAVLRVQPPEGSRVNALPFSALATEKDLSEIGFHLASPVFILGFPTRFEANAAGFPIARNGTVASFPLLPVKVNRTFIIDFTTFAGDSGGPVFLPDPRRKEADGEASPLIVGLVLAQLRHDEEVKKLYEEQYIHYPLALGVTQQAQVIREAIELAPKPAPADQP